MRNLRHELKEAEIKDYLLNFDFFEKYVGNRQEGEDYVTIHLRRFLYTLDFIALPFRDIRVLELGAIPYYMTILVKKYLGYDVVPSSCFEILTSPGERHILTNEKYKERYEFEYNMVNIEREKFPFEDKSFDMVLCCEVLEHLLINPSHMLYEAHRVLKDDGFLMISTPNVLRLENIYKILRGRNIYDTYHGNGIYGRHNREYTPDEVKLLLERNNFGIGSLNMVNCYNDSFPGRVSSFIKTTRDSIFLKSSPLRRPVAHYPSGLYSIMEEYHNVVYDYIIMDERDVGQLGRGWYYAEPGEGSSFRWSKKEAEVYLKVREPGYLSVRAFCHHTDMAENPAFCDIYLNSEFLGRMSFRDRKSEDFSFNFPEKLFNGIVKVTFKTSSVWNPHNKLGTGDNRDLGIAVERVWAG